MKKFIEEFKAFALKGNIIDLAVAVVIGGAFNTIVKSLVSDIIMPLFGVITGGVNFNSLKIVLVHAAGKKPAVTLNIGMFIQNVVNFLIIALSIFVVIKLFTKLQRNKADEEEVVEEKIEENTALLREIRDLLSGKKPSEEDETSTDEDTVLDTKKEEITKPSSKDK
ncbi:large-conductance mechanosensitive channel protein MscL [uncultured Clostridium sp.]|uniref:large-conductance mechanosensitive channel protein MscL n=1 Tax=uncultured Clostridium sp. TaxID=59620 RepID=UPI00344C8DDC